MELKSNKLIGAEGSEKEEIHQEHVINTNIIAADFNVFETSEYLYLSTGKIHVVNGDMERDLGDIKQRWHKISEWFFCRRRKFAALEASQGASS